MTVKASFSVGVPPVPLIVRLLKDGVPDATVGVPEVPVKATVEPPGVNVPPEFVSNVPVVPVKVIVELLAVNVPPLIKIDPEVKALLPAPVVSTAVLGIFTLLKAAEGTSIVIVTVGLIKTLSPAPGIPPAPEQFAQFAPVFQLPVVVAVQYTVSNTQFVFPTVLFE